MTHVRQALILMTAVLAACGNSSNRGTGDDDQPPADAASPDSTAPPPDAPASPLLLAAGGNDVAFWRFDSEPVGMHGTVTFTVANTSGVMTSALAASISGDDAAQFAIDPTSSCLGATLPAAGTCQLIATFTPTGAAGDRNAVLHVTGSTAEVQLALLGAATPAPTGLTADVTALDFGLVELAHASTRQVTLTNGGTATIHLQPPTTTSVFSAPTTTCGATIAPAASCTIDVQMLTTQLGASSGNLTVASDAETVTVHLAGAGARRLSVTVVGPGAVTGDNFNCMSGTCDGLFAGNAAGDVTLAAAANADAQLIGWSPICGAATSCVIPASSTVAALTATFITTTATPVVHIHFAGSGFGEVHFVGDYADTPPCLTSCDLPVTKASQLTLRWATPSTFVGWTGDCTVQSGDCMVDTNADRNITVTFNKDAREVTMVTVSRTPEAIAFALDGNLLTGDSTGVSEVKLDGTVVWTTAITGGVHGLVTDDTGRIYGAGGATPATAFAFSLTATGASRWTHSTVMTFPRNTEDSINSPVQVSRDGSVVASRSATKVTVLDGATGALVFSSLTGFTSIEGLAVASDGSVTFSSLTGADPDSAAVYHYDTAGNPIGTIDQIYGNRSVSFAFDASNNRGSLGAGFSNAHTYYKPPTGTGWDDQKFRNDNSTSVCGLTFDSGGNTIGTFQMNVAGQGMRIEQRNAAGGAVLWSVEKYPGGYYFDDVPVPYSIAADHSKRIAVALDWYDPIIAIYQMP